MKKMMKLSLVLAAATLAFSSCNCFKQMAQHKDDVKLTCTPEVLELNNGVVAADINVTFPEQYFNKKAVLKVTPVLVFEGGELAAAPVYLQGSKVDDNYTVVGRDNVGTFSHHVEFPYDARMQLSELQLRAEIKCPKGKCKEFTLVNLNDGAIPTKKEAAVLAGDDEAAKKAIERAFGLTIAYGVNTLQNDIDYAAMMDPRANNYKKVTTEVSKADILYAINSSVVTKKAKKNADLDAFKANVDANLKNDRASQNIAVKGYASPDGPEKFNDKLSEARSNTGKKTVAELLKDAGLNIDAAAYGEDWEGFKELVEKSDIKDKALILQVLSLYSNSAQRESEIKNMATVFNELKDEILPQLRRSQVVNTTDIQGKTDEEILACIKNGQQLTVEEYLYAADKLAKTPAEQAAILGTASKKYNDARVYNNLGIAQAEQGDMKAALASFEKAAKLEATSEVNNNYLRAVIATKEGNLNTAEAQLKSAVKKEPALAQKAQKDVNLRDLFANGFRL